MRVDQNIIEAINLWITHGINPGSCTKLLLQGDYAKAYLHAHPILKHPGIWQSHIDYIESIPAKYRGKNMQKHKDSFQDI